MIPALRGKAVEDDVQLGRYYHSDHRLYRVEQRHERGVIVEDCASGDLVNLPASELRQMTPVRVQNTAPEDG